MIETLSGIRRLFDDGKGNPSAVTRNYVFHMGGAPMLNVFGDKITTFRELSEHALQRLKPYFPQMGRDWTVQGAPGRRYSWRRNAAVRQGAAHGVSFFARDSGPALRDPLWHGCKILASAKSLADLGQKFGPTFYEGEARYLIMEESAGAADVILRRRTKHVLTMRPDNRVRFSRWLDDAIAPRALGGGDAFYAVVEQQPLRQPLQRTKRPHRDDRVEFMLSRHFSTDARLPSYIRALRDAKRGDATHGRGAGTD